MGHVIKYPQKIQASPMCSIEMDFMEVRSDFQKCLDEEGTLFPPVLCPGEACRSVPDTFAANREWLDAKLLKSGAILFRGFNVQTAQEFNSVVDALGFEEFPYIETGGAGRTRVFGKVLMNDNVAADEDIGFHSEASYLENPPTRLMFFCEIPPPPGTGGATTIVHGHSVYKRLFSEQKSFLDILSDGYGPKTRPLPAWKKDRAGRVSWFNGLGYLLTAKSLELPIPLVGSTNKVLTKKDLQPCLKIMEEEKVEVDWQKGDMLLVDNTAVQHGRKAFFSERKILIALVK